MGDSENALRPLIEYLEKRQKFSSNDYERLKDEFKELDHKFEKLKQMVIEKFDTIGPTLLMLSTEYHRDKGR